MTNIRRYKAYASASFMRLPIPYFHPLNSQSSHLANISSTSLSDAIPLSSERRNSSANSSSENTQGISWAFNNSKQPSNAFSSLETAIEAISLFFKP